LHGLREVLHRDEAPPRAATRLFGDAEVITCPLRRQVVRA
jgi:hypothetical protein